MKKMGDPRDYDEVDEIKTEEQIPVYESTPEFDMLVRHAFGMIPQTVDGVPLYAGMVCFDRHGVEYRIKSMSVLSGMAPVIHGWPVKNGGIVGQSSKLGIENLFAMVENADSSETTERS